MRLLISRRRARQVAGGYCPLNANSLSLINFLVPPPKKSFPSHLLDIEYPQSQSKSERHSFYLQQYHRVDDAATLLPSFNLDTARESFSDANTEATQDALLLPAETLRPFIIA